jgi:hypothetical protein
MRAYACEESALALLDRGVAGIRGRTLIVNLPAGVAALFLKAVVDVIAPIVAHLREDIDAPLLTDALAPTQLDAMPEEVQPSAAPPPQDHERRSAGKKLDADEFAAFLRRQSPNA